MEVLIADDHMVVREGLKQIIRNLEHINTIDESSRGDEAWEKIRKGNYDLVILDLSMPGMNGLDVLKKIKDHNLKIHVLILSIYPQEHYAVRAFNLGASGYVSKDSLYEELALAIKKIASGGRFITSAFAEKIAFEGHGSETRKSHDALSEREFQVLIMLAQGNSVTEISNKILVSDKTVSTYRARILDKMRLKNNTEITLYAVRNNLIE